MSNIPFNRPHTVGTEFGYIQEAIDNGHLSGNGPFTKRCQGWIREFIGCRKVLLTHSCTAALEMAAILVDIQPGDEVIMPSYTFVSTANAFALRRGVPVFVDIRPDTLNLDESRIEELITPATKAIVAVHYGGVGCEMDTIMDIAQRHGLYVIEDAAQGMMSTYKGIPLGNIGHIAAMSFHETKNVICGEGGALLINDPRFIERSEIVWEKGTNRGQFSRGEIDKYSWVDIGSSYLPSEINAAFLWAQLEEAESITRKRLDIWGRYHQEFTRLEAQGKARRPTIPPECRHNAHMYFLLLSDSNIRSVVIDQLKEDGINAVFHYIPLHSSLAGKEYGRVQSNLSYTEELSSSLIRLPLWVGMTGDDVNKVVTSVFKALQS